MTTKITFVVTLFTISVLLLGTMATPLNMLPSAEALKGQGVSSSKYGSATKGTVCGDKLCSEVRAEEAKKQEKEKEVKETSQQQSTENKKEIPPSTSQKKNTAPVEDKSKDSSKTFITKPGKFPIAKILSSVPSSQNTHSLIFQVCASEQVDMRAPEVVISSDSAVKNVKLNNVLLKGTCSKTASAILATDSSSISIKVIDKTKLNKMIEKTEKELDRIKNEIEDINSQLQTKLNTPAEELRNNPNKVKEINELILKLKDLREERRQLTMEYYELIYTLKPVSQLN